MLHFYNEIPQYYFCPICNCWHTYPSKQPLSYYNSEENYLEIKCSYDPIGVNLHIYFKNKQVYYKIITSTRKILDTSYGGSISINKFKQVRNHVFMVHLTGTHSYFGFCYDKIDSIWPIKSELKQIR